MNYCQVAEPIQCALIIMSTEFSDFRTSALKSSEPRLTTGNILMSLSVMCLPNHAQYTVNACTCTMCRSLDKRVLGDVYEQFQVVEA